MREKIRSAPSVPDHEVLRKIGGGSYGDVWMARAVTGVMRAIKVIWREDFENDRDFEREFEGIKNYEPISRNHPGLIPILHVGRKKGKDEFYYYVMELADDIENGQKIHPVEYEPRTLRTDLVAADKSPMEVDRCIKMGLQISKALEYLHDQGLAHRDVKPGNIIYLGGKARLADIGLVAMPGQMTFVGTQGFVPPEGPGTRRSDIYALGKVLYEMCTGMDRMDFPNLPECTFTGEQSKRWKTLNSIICDMCDPRESARNLKRAPQVIDALEEVSAGKGFKRKKIGGASKGGFLKSAALAALIVGMLIVGVRRGWLTPQTTEAEKVYVPVKITSTPSGAEVWTMDGEYLGTTPLAGRELEVGRYAQYNFRLEGYSNTVQGAQVLAPAVIIEAKLPVFAPPQAGKRWSDVLGLSYMPDEDTHLSSVHVMRWPIARFLKSGVDPKTLAFGYGKVEVGRFNRDVAVMTKESAVRYCEWLTEISREGGYLTEDSVIVPQMDLKSKVSGISDKMRKANLRPFRCRVLAVPYASMKIFLNTDEEATIYIEGEVMEAEQDGNVVEIKRVPPEKLNVRVEVEGYRSVTKAYTFGASEKKEITVNLKANNSVIFDKQWTNSLGMLMVPFNDRLMVAQNETTVASYTEFCKQKKYPMPANPVYPQTAGHPVVFVSRADAMNFCEWLTKRERRELRIGETHTYRLPTDLEWSALAGLHGESGKTPFERDVEEDESFVWGGYWPPLYGDGNLAGYESEFEDAQRVIESYDDGEAYAAVVGVSSPNENNLHDLAGNVYEWVSDDFGVGEYGVTRGGSWKSYQKENLYRKFRNPLSPETKNQETGFRIILSKEM